MAIQGKKINELDLLQEDLTGNTVIPAVYINNGVISQTANKVTVNQISNKIQTDMSTIIAEKQDKLIAGDNITISEENVISATNSGGGSIPTLTWYVGNTGTSITISDTSTSNLVKIYKNGILLQPTQDYTISETTLTLVTALIATDKITTEIY